MAGNPQDWWASLTPVTQWWLALSVATSVGTKLNLLGADRLILSLDLVLRWSSPQVWRLLTTFVFFGKPSFQWLISMWMLCVAPRGGGDAGAAGSAAPPLPALRSLTHSLTRPRPLLPAAARSSCPTTSATPTRAAAATTLATSPTWR